MPDKFAILFSWASSPTLLKILASDESTGLNLSIYSALNYVKSNFFTRIILLVIRCKPLYNNNNNTDYLQI